MTTLTGLSRWAHMPGVEMPPAGGDSKLVAADALLADRRQSHVDGVLARRHSFIGVVPQSAKEAGGTALTSDEIFGLVDTSGDGRISREVRALWHTSVRFHLISTHRRRAAVGRRSSARSTR